jgi:hypothetical protein
MKYVDVTVMQMRMLLQLAAVHAQDGGGQKVNRMRQCRQTKNMMRTKMVLMAGKDDVQAVLGSRGSFAGLRSGSGVVLFAAGRLNFDGDFLGAWGPGVLDSITIFWDNSNGSSCFRWNFNVRMSGCGDWSIGSNSGSVGN